MGNDIHETHEELDLRSRLSEIARIPIWIEELASKHAIPKNVKFAIDLCLEEVLSNIIQHGYGGSEDRSILVGFAMPRKGCFAFDVNDEAPHFNPLDVPQPSALNPTEETSTGGQGINLLRAFADVLEYEATPTGNRLRMYFSAADSKVSKK